MNDEAAAGVTAWRKTGGPESAPCCSRIMGRLVERLDGTDSEVETSDDIGEDLFNTSLRLDREEFSLEVVVVDDRLIGRVESLEALHDRRLVVVRSSARLRPLQDTSLHRFVTHLEVDDAIDKSDLAFEAFGLFKFARIAVDEKSFAPVKRVLDGISQ